MNNDAILASINKIHAYRYAKEKQRGVLTANGGFSVSDPTLLQVPCTIQCVFTPKDLSKRQFIFASGLTQVYPRIDIIDQIDIGIYIAETIIRIPAVVEKLYNISFVVDADKQQVFVDGDLIREYAYHYDSLEYYILGNLSISSAYNFNGDILLHRHFNYAMSADEVKALDNNGDPLGYVVPKAMKSGDNKCIAEYLPQNLVGSSTDKTIVTIWLDSAKQLPWSDAYLPPLLQSNGGYDMIANGAPEVLFNE